MARFGRAEVSVDNIKSLCDRKGWRNGRDGRLKPGNVPPNKGRRGYYAPGSEKGWFKKGQVPRNIKPMWHERPGKDGYIEMSDAPGIGLELDEEVAREHIYPGTTWFE